MGFLVGLDEVHCVGLRVGARVSGILVGKGSVLPGPTLSLHPHETEDTESEQKTVRFVVLQNSPGSWPSTCVPKKVKDSKVATKFPSSIGMVPVQEIRW